MIMNLQGQLTILKSMNIKPNFSELAREYDLDRRTVKKYYEGYEGKSKTRNKMYFILNLCAKFSLKSQPSIYGKYGKWIL